jgi:hypothetical protein
MDTIIARAKDSFKDHHPEEDKLVSVRRYFRYRLDNWEVVKAHPRRWPRKRAKIIK